MCTHCFARTMTISILIIKYTGTLSRLRQCQFRTSHKIPVRPVFICWWCVRPTQTKSLSKKRLAEPVTCRAYAQHNHRSNTWQRDFHGFFPLYIRLNVRYPTTLSLASWHFFFIPFSCLTAVHFDVFRFTVGHTTVWSGRCAYAQTLCGGPSISSEYARSSGYFDDIGNKHTDTQNPSMRAVRPNKRAVLSQLCIFIYIYVYIPYRWHILCRSVQLAISQECCDRPEKLCPHTHKPERWSAPNRK